MENISDTNALIYYLNYINFYENELKKQRYYYHIFKRSPEEILNEHRNVKKILKKARSYDKTNKYFRNP
jgi:hypothetical protein